MKIIVISNKPVLTQFGRLPKGVPVDVPDNLAQFLIDRGEASFMEVKTGTIDPSPADEKKPRGRATKAD